MADLIINGTTYSGSPTDTSHPQRPDNGGVKRTTRIIGRTLEAANGDVSVVQRARKHAWEISWTKANPTTLTALAAVVALATTFTFVDTDGASYTALCTTDDVFDVAIFTNKANAYQYTVTLRLREA